MLTKNSDKTLRIVFMFLTIFCIIPYDWDRKRRKLSKTTSVIKRVLNNLMVFGFPPVLLYLSICLAVEFRYESLPIEKIAFNTIIVIAGGFAMSIGVVGNLCGEEYTDLFNVLFEMDAIYQDEFLKEVEETPEKFYKGKIVLVDAIKWAIEPLAFVHTFGAGLLFFEESDMFRRYIYTPFEWFFGLEDDWRPKVVFILGYMGVIRLVYSYLILVVYAIAAYGQITIGWLEFHVQYPHILMRNQERQIRYYRTQEILNKVFNTCDAMKILTPEAISVIFVLNVLCNYCTITLFGSVNFGTYLINPTGSILIVVGVRAWFRHAGALREVSAELLTLWAQNNQNQRLRNPAEFRKCLKSFVPLKNSVNQFFDLDRATHFQFQDNVIDKTISLLLA